jgi:AMP deaminase
MAVDSDDDGEQQFYQSQQTKKRGEKMAQRRSSRADKPSDTANDDDDDDDGSLPPDTPELSSSDEIEDTVRHPFYSYVTEKQDSFADAKVIYQRHRLDTKSSQELGSPYPLNKASTMPNFLDNDASGSNRTGSFFTRRDFAGPKISTSNDQAPSQKKEMFPTLATHLEENKDPALLADARARSHQHHPDLPHEFKDPLLASEGVHGAGAGVGLGSGPSGLARNEESIVSEVSAICEKIKTLLDLRQRFMKVSLQCPGDNPKDYEDWEIYPAPPEPVWTDDKNRPSTHNSMNGDDQPPTRNSSSLYMHDGPNHNAASNRARSDSGPVSPATARRRRKPGHDIGEDFDLHEATIPGEDRNGLHFRMDERGVYQVHDRSDKQLTDIPTLRDYYMALDQVLDVSSDGPAKSFAYRRLQYLEGRYNLYTLLNEYEEVSDTKKVPHRDFYNVRKVDTHVHHSACMNQKHLLRFIKSKMKKCPDDKVIDRDGKVLTLSEVFETINLTAYDLSIDTLDMHAHTDSFHRFDKFNLKYNPIGQSRLRDIFLKTDNYIKGKYLAEITREVIADLESSKYQMVRHCEMYSCW